VAIAVTATLVTVKVAVVAPVPTITVAGTVPAAVLLLDSVTVLCAFVPSAGAFNVTVPVELAAPPTTLGGLRVAAETINGFTVSVAFADPFKVPVITGLVIAETT
jgi:hypothetical protein